MADVTSPARIKRSGSAIYIINPIKTPNTITLISLSNFARNSPIIELISDTEISTPVRNTPKPMITPRHPKKKFTKSPVSTPTNKFNTITRMAIVTTDLAVFLISSINKKLTFFLKFSIKKEQPN